MKPVSTLMIEMDFDKNFVIGGLRIRSVHETTRELIASSASSNSRILDNTKAGSYSRRMLLHSLFNTPEHLLASTVILSPDRAAGEAGRMGFLAGLTNRVDSIRWILYTVCTTYVNNEEGAEKVPKEYLY